MKLALIPPVSQIQTVNRSTYQLVLPQVCAQYPDYNHQYMYESGRNDFIILDNGVAEGELVNEDSLMTLARELVADEVVAPDTMYDAKKTVQQFVEFNDYAYDWWTDHGTHHRGPGLMYVAQGSTEEEILDGVADVLSRSTMLSSIGLPRHLLATLNDGAEFHPANPYARIDLAVDLYLNFLNKSSYRPFDIHFLGAAPSFIREASMVRKLCPWVRGMDTSAPYNYAHAGINLAKQSSEVVNRPEAYFKLEGLDQQLVDTNISVMLDWAHGVG